MPATTIFLVPTILPNGDMGEGLRHLCEDCMGPDDWSEGQTPGHGDDECEVCGALDWEPEEDDEEED